MHGSGAFYRHRIGKTHQAGPFCKSVEGTSNRGGALQRPVGRGSDRTLKQPMGSGSPSGTEEGWNMEVLRRLPTA